jgi:pSer/pThr/pTyr-binding forkhead associated (FHA) protein
MDPSQPPDQAAGLPASGPHQPHAAEAAPAGFVPLRLLLQPSGAAIEVDRSDSIVGRHSEADVRLPLPDVSRRHCRLSFVEGCWQVIDLNSLNGTHVNGEAVLQAPLEPGDLLRVGGFTFAVEVGRPGPGHVASILKRLSDPRRRAG